MTTTTATSIGAESGTSPFNDTRPFDAARSFGETRPFDQGRPGSDSSERSASMAAAVDRIASGAHQAIDRIAAAASSAADHLNFKGEDLAAGKDRLAETCVGYVKDNPLTALGIAAAVGFLASRWIR